MTTHNVPIAADFWPRSLHAAALIVPFGLLAAGTAIDRTAASEDDTAYLDQVAAAPVPYLVGGLLLALGMALLVPCAAALVRVAAGRRRTAVLRIGAIFIGVWGVLGTVGVSLGYTAGWVGADVADVIPAAPLREVFEGITYSPWGLIGGGIGGTAYVLGLLAAGVGLILARGVPIWTGVLVLAAPVATFTGGPLGIPILMAGGFVLAGVGFAGAIPTLLRAPRLVTFPPTVQTPSVLAEDVSQDLHSV